MIMVYKFNNKLLGLSNLSNGNSYNLLFEKVQKQLTLRKNIYGLEHCVPSDSYKYYHIYQPP